VEPEDGTVVADMPESRQVRVRGADRRFAEPDDPAIGEALNLGRPVAGAGVLARDDVAEVRAVGRRGSAGAVLEPHPHRDHLPLGG
jgi:hypothetical protein